MRKRFLLCAACIAIVACVSAQKNKRSLLYNLVTEHKAALRKMNLFTESDTIAFVNNKANSVVSAFAALKLSVPAVLDIAASKPEGLQLEIPFRRYKNFSLKLVKQKLNSDGNFSFGTLHGNFIKTKMAGEAGVHYRGYINGDSTSIASISFFKDGTLMALFANKDGNFVIGRMGDDKSNYIIYNDRNLKIPQHIQCGTDDAIVYGRPHAEGAPVPNTPQDLPPTLCSKVMLYWEGDFELYDYNFKRNLTSTQNYMEGLFNEVATMYQNEGIIVQSSGMLVWTSADPYRNNSSSNGLTDFQSHWNGKNDEFGGDLAHLIAGGTTNNGGLAYVLGNLCGKNYSYAYSNVWGMYQDVPTWSWDVEVVTHETGHNLGSRHTQWCGWNTGAGGTCGAIDNCYTLEASNTCTTCPAIIDTANLPVDWQGTVMSYCHLSSIGINLANGFGPLPQDVIRNTINISAGCLRSLIAATATAQPICNTNDGAVSVSFDADNLGTAPYTYFWAPGAYTTQNISGLSTPGDYMVTITDKAACTVNLSATVKALGNPGALLPLNIAQPVCCMETDDSITLKTKSPKILDDCETIGWVRSKTELKTYNDVLNAYTNAKPSDIFFSTNSNTKDSGVLKIKPPVSCAADSTWYYAAFISKKQVDGKKITGNSAYQGNVVGNDGTTIGSYVDIADQNASVSGCLKTETPDITLKVVVRLYTGRADHLAIEIQDKNFNYITGLFNQPGKGTYQINTAALKDMPLDDIKILCYDYNCNQDSCVDAGITFTATREVTYAGVSKPTFEEACSVAASNKLSFSSNIAQCTVLAVSFNNFNVSENNCSVDVNWQTTNETGNSFVVERSTDGRNFLPVAAIQPKGQEINNYNYIDYSAATGKNYYRIKETDADGKTTYTAARMIELSCSGKNKVMLYPNPARSEVFMRSAQAISRVEVVNNAGQVIIKASNLSFQAGISKLNISKLSAGVYVCKITLADGSVENIKLVKH